jgi:catechol 2,3-dioxygenase-like lactoylglutathione lyase family enzyme
MQIEHIGFLVNAPISMGKWYCEHFGFRVVRSSGDDSAGGVFLKDDASGVTVELCKVAGKAIYDYRALEPLQAHIAIDCADPHALAEKLAQAGASIIEQSPKTPGSNMVVMVRDPWGFAIQLINRVEKLE